MNGSRFVVLSLVVVVILAAAPPAIAAHADEAIVLPGASSAEGIAKGTGSTFYAGDLLRGDIFRGDVRRGTAELFIDAPDGRMAAGMAVDVRHRLLFVAGVSTGGAYVYDTRTGATVASYQFTDQPSLINDVAISKDGAWFTDSVNPVLYHVPIGPRGTLGAFRTLELAGRAAETPGEVNNNGIQATPNGKTLIVAHSAQGALNLVDPSTGESSAIAGLNLPDVDGLLLAGHRRLYAVQNFLNQIAEIRLSPDYRAGVVRRVITSELFQVPATVARFGHRLAAVNAKFDTGFPPTADQYEVVVVHR